MEESVMTCCDLDLGIGWPCYVSIGGLTTAGAQLIATFDSAARSERVDIVGDRDLAQKHPADPMRRLYPVGEDSDIPCRACGQSCREGFVIQLDAHDEGCGRNRLRRHRRAGDARLPGGDRLQSEEREGRNAEFAN